MVVPAAIGKPAEVTQATYDKITISTGRIFTPYYGAYIYTNAAEALLVTSVVDSLYVERLFSFVDGEMWNEDFDLEFIRPRRIGGGALIEITNFIKLSQGFTVDVTLGLYRVDEDSVEHQLGNIITLPTITGLSSGSKTIRRTAKIMIPVTKFRVGDLLRLSVIGYGGQDSATNYAGFGCDPSGRAGTYCQTNASTLILATPFIPDF